MAHADVRTVISELAEAVRERAGAQREQGKECEASECDAVAAFIEAYTRFYPNTSPVRTGQEAARRRGVHIGRPRQVCPPALMERARELLAQGGSVRQVAKAVGVSRGTLLRRLKEREE